ncbi:MAG: hypothetical protein HZB59_09930 [Ignavibacteriales bacterium]|nr:hypothetical protein [Ignavibacteriales bacterium]
MIDIQLTEDEDHSIIQALESERDIFIKDLNTSSLSIVREVSNRVIDHNNSLIRKLEEQVGVSIGII